jgi:hypothetical protein
VCNYPPKTIRKRWILLIRCFGEDFDAFTILIIAKLKQSIRISCSLRKELKDQKWKLELISGTDHRIHIVPVPSNKTKNTFACACAFSSQQINCKNNGAWSLEHFRDQRQQILSLICPWPAHLHLCFWRLRPQITIYTSPGNELMMISLSPRTHENPTASHSGGVAH